MLCFQPVGMLEISFYQSYHFSFFVNVSNSQNNSDQMQEAKLMTNQIFSPSGDPLWRPFELTMKQSLPCENQIIIIVTLYYTIFYEIIDIIIIVASL